MKVAIYVRVSTASKTRQADTGTFIQNPDVQEQPLRDMVAQRGWTVYRVYSDRASGAKEKRPGLDALMADARRGMFDAVVVWRFDRFARSVKQLVLALEEFKALGIDFISYSEALDSSTPMGRAMFTIIAAMAELERNIIQERVIAGLNYARDNGTKSGNNVGRPRKIFRRDTVLELREGGKSWRQIAALVHAGVSTVRRVAGEEKPKGVATHPGGEAA